MAGTEHLRVDFPSALGLDPVTMRYMEKAVLAFFANRADGRTVFVVGPGVSGELLVAERKASVARLRLARQDDLQFQG